MKKQIFIFDKIISKYQRFSEAKKKSIDVFLKVAIVVLFIILIYNIGVAVGEYLFNVGVEI